MCTLCLGFLFIDTNAMARFVRVVVHGVFQVWVRLITPKEEQVVTVAFSRDDGWALLEIIRIH